MRASEAHRRCLLVTLRDQRHEAAEFSQPGSDLSVLFVDELQLLGLIAAYRNDHATAFHKLIRQFVRELGSGSGDQNRVVARRLRKTSASVSYNNSHVSITEIREQ